MFVCHPNDVCEDSFGSVYVGEYCGVSENEPCVFGKLYPVDFPVVCKSSSVLLHSIVTS